MNKIKIGIVGYGFVGKAIARGFENDKVEQVIIDPLLDTNIESLDGQDIEATFVCVPTPMGECGKINASIVKNTIEYLMENVSGLIILKSTVVPEIIKEINSMDGAHRFVYNPEFLTEKNAVDDFLNPFMHVFGCNNEECSYAIRRLYDNFSNCNETIMRFVTPEEASFIKYGINSFLATKVSWFNQFYHMVQNEGCDYDKIVSVMGLDSRVSPGHTQVPGPNGQFGYNGSCFPKDTMAFYQSAKSKNINMSILGEAIEYNSIVRSQYDLDDREKEQNVTYNIKL